MLSLIVEIERSWSRDEEQVETLLLKPQPRARTFPLFFLRLECGTVHVMRITLIYGTRRVEDTAGCACIELTNKACRRQFPFPRVPARTNKSPYGVASMDHPVTVWCCFPREINQLLFDAFSKLTNPIQRCGKKLMIIVTSVYTSKKRQKAHKEGSKFQGGTRTSGHESKVLHLTTTFVVSLMYFAVG
jgi:hypothetical protein